MNKKYAFFVCCNGQYIPYLNALLNSIDKWGINIDLFLMYYDFDKKYLETITSSFDYPIYPLKIKREDFDIHKYNERNNNLFIKQSRFKYIRENGLDYDVICMLDADMFITTPNYLNLFDLVNGTNKLIGCNERFKWVFDRKYVARGERIFPNNVKAHKFHCSVPIIFDLKEWTNVFDTYNDMAYNAFEVSTDGKIKKSIGDIYCWNISVYKHKRQNDVVLFPMETMTQVHQTNLIAWTRVTKNQNYWMTFAGDEVWSIHGRIGTPGWRGMHTRKMDQLIGEGQITSADKWVSPDRIRKQAESTLRLIEKEWYDLNFNHKVNLYDFKPENKYWDKLK